MKFTVETKYSRDVEFYEMYAKARGEAFASNTSSLPFSYKSLALAFRELTDWAQFGRVVDW